MTTLRDYVVRVELREFGQVVYRDIEVRESSAREAKSSVRRAGYRPVVAVWRKDPVR